jgi:membrane-associated protease RseP (regulator of RpoE activity)
VIIERSVESPQPPTPPQNDYVPQMNRTTTVLGAQASGAAVLGVTMDPEYPNAAVVRQVTPGSAAEKGGLRAGDMITSIDKTEIRSPADVTNLVATKQAGDQLEIAFIRPVLRSEVKEAAPEQGLGITAPATPAPAASAPAEPSTQPTEEIPPPVPQPPTPQAD